MEKRASLFLQALCFAFVGVIAGLDQAQAGDLSCRQKSARSDWFIWNQDGKIIGHQSYGFDHSAGCEKMADSQNGNLVCAWNGRSYQIYNTENGQSIGSAPLANYWTNLNDCADAIKAQPAQSLYVCSWNGKAYTPFNRETNQILSANNQLAWRKLADCVSQSVNAAYKNLICGWNGGAYLYTAEGKIVSPKLKNIQDCNALMKSIKASDSQNQISEKLSSLGKVISQRNLPSSFSNIGPDAKVGFHWKTCEVARDFYHLTKSVNGIITPECSPDTLYSWGSFEKIEWFLDHLNQEAGWTGPLERSLFTVSSPAATFGYGQIPIRIKLKPNVRIKYVRFPTHSKCDRYLIDGTLTSNELKNTIVARLGSSGSTFFEYTICSKDVIESWSYGTPEHFDEILRDHAWKTTKHYYEWEGYEKRDGVDRYIGATIDSQSSQYSTDFSITALIDRMTFYHTLSDSGYGAVISRDQTGRDQHFKTQKPIYFNPE